MLENIPTKELDKNTSNNFCLASKEIDDFKSYSSKKASLNNPYKLTPPKWLDTQLKNRTIAMNINKNNPTYSPWYVL
jgi:hypothetical protein